MDGDRVSRALDDRRTVRASSPVAEGHRTRVAGSVRSLPCAALEPDAPPWGAFERRARGTAAHRRAAAPVGAASLVPCRPYAGLASRPARREALGRSTSG